MNRLQYQQERKELLQIAQEIFSSGLVSGTWGNVSLRVSGPGLMLITPSGMDYNQMEAEDMVLLDGEEKVLAGKYKPSVETPLHLGIYKKRPEINAIVHVHSLYATAFAVARQNIPVILEEAAQVIGHEVRVAPYALCGSQQLAENVLKVLGKDKRAVLLANHGLLGLGGNLPEALRVCLVAERTARIAIYSRVLGPLHSLRAEDILSLRQAFRNYGQKKD
ncbi:class II aldolase/adducin family protein [Syntrophomonas wolfei]|jgi:L-fuculose-phosphate aldolase|uniref:Class II aldolase n=1 Tax=Syntrophomonas wolfei TaxID=863 RepID=A0A354YV78_9FIRM|nr:class II aldolase/adducin family protein [Syntrophomonas wolfei]HBK53089.1 class II aldolase [Syntrophomonas wolfei]